MDLDAKTTFQTAFVFYQFLLLVLSGLPNFCAWLRYGEVRRAAWFAFHAILAHFPRSGKQLENFLIEIYRLLKRACGRLQRGEDRGSGGGLNNRRKVVLTTRTDRTENVFIRKNDEKQLNFRMRIAFSAIIRTTSIYLSDKLCSCTLKSALNYRKVYDARRRHFFFGFSHFLGVGEREGGDKENPLTLLLRQRKFRKIEKTLARAILPKSQNIN